MSNTKRIKVLNYRNANGISPNPDNIDYGEIAIGYKKDNEAIYIKNTANDIVDFTPISIVNITYNELKELRDNSKLKPSQYYRITDFVTTVANDNEARSAGYRFDIIVMASEKNKLQEECYAIQHEGDTYFANCNLAAWKIWYCLDNDNTKYAWADTTNGKGVIYRMIDEWQNDCPYDFKNVQFKRYYTNGLQNGYDVIAQGYFANDNNSHIFPEGTVDTEHPLYCYTFTRLNEIESGYGKDTVTQDKILDESIQTLGFSSDTYTRCQNNVLGHMKSASHILTNNVFLTISTYKEEVGSYYLPSFGNKIGLNCSNNTFGSDVYGLTFGDGCSDNIIGDDCYYNTFGDRCSSNTFGNSCYNNSIKDSCYSNTFGNNCHNNSFRDGCNNNSFENACSSNSFGNTCNYNSFKQSCSGNTFGVDCGNNSFGNGCNYNSFGNNCHYNSFRDDCNNNSFENACNYNKFGYSCYNNTFGNDCHNNTFGNNCNNNSFENGCYSNTFGYSCYNNTFRDNCYSNTFRDNCNNNSFENDCNSNLFGNICNYNSFGNNCYSNTFGDDCNNNSFENDCHNNTFGNYFQHNALGNDIQYIEIPTEKIYHTQILNGTKGTSANKLTIAFTPETEYSQFAGFTSDNVLETWVEADDIVNITYNELKNLRDNSKLKPSQHYRITDFVTTVANDDEARSAGHPFDIIVLASDKDRLQEECYAIQHEDENDTYFDNCNLAAWKIWYCLDNDNTKYAWADTTNGKGVIYRMIDEWQNDCPYDFKNIMFNRTVTAGDLDINGVYYTFSWVNKANEVEDASIVGQTLTNDEGTVNGVHDNLISASDAYSLGIGKNTMALALNGNVFVSEHSYEGGLFYGIYGNHFATNCYNNTFGNDCYGNSFGNDCNSNSFGNGCHNNSFKNGCYSNTFWYNCYNNTFGNYCNSNTFGNGCGNNSFGNECYSNTFGNGCGNNSFGNECYSNTFGNDCNNNSFENSCGDNLFGNYFQHNALGNDIQYIEIPTEKIYHTQILNGTKGTYNNKLTIEFTPETTYSQFAGFTSDNVLETWVEADAPHDTVDGGSY